jgi:hypothetical protein
MLCQYLLQIVRMSEVYKRNTGVVNQTVINVLRSYVTANDVGDNKE